MSFDALRVTSPASAGMPEKFVKWRPGQLQAVVDILDSCKKFTVMVCPTGFGKSLMYMTAAVQRHKQNPRSRTVILTSTKGLQTQLYEDFKDIGAADLRGKNAYRCKRDPALSCDKCVSNYKLPCPHNEECDYWEAYRKASKASILITNYACYMAVKRYMGKHSEGLGYFDFIVCDEGHAVPDAVSSFLTCRLYHRKKEIAVLRPPESDEFSVWMQWARANLPQVKKDADKLRGRIAKGDNATDTLSAFEVLSGAVRTLETIKDFGSDKGWVVDRTQRSHVVFSPVFLSADASARVLFGGAKAVFTSATIRPKTLDLLGIKSADRKVIEYPHPFDAERRKIVCLNTVRLNAKSPPAHYKLLAAAVDGIIRGRRDRKGIIHTVSFERAETIFRLSLHKEIMHLHQRGGDKIEAVVKKFRESAAPAILVSPSIGTGYDFPYNECRYQIIVKLPYPDTRGKLMRERCSRDPDYGPYIAALSTVQMHGRGMRAADDFCETFIMDSSYRWFMPKYGRDFMPEWFREAVSSTSIIPKPPLLRRQIQEV